jgi:2-polyprenyl-3-methyl-5-hydroxy-6-metoxy-1,4-benzoquinol methylase
VSDSKTESAHSRIVRSYFQTTSAASYISRNVNYEQLSAGLRRGLRDWCDVAGKDVVDLGCGTGELCWVAQHCGARKVIGINLCPEEIEFASQHVQAEFMHQDIVSFLSQCPAMSIDRIFALNILEHLDKDTLVRVLEGAFHALRAGGRLVAMVPNATSPFGGMTRYWDITHQNAFTPSSVRQLARLVGFGAAVEFRECGPIPHGVISGVRYVLWQMTRLVIHGYLMVELASDKGGIYTADMMFRLTKHSGARE